jgi:hypothetical protein
MAPATPPDPNGKTLEEYLQELVKQKMLENRARERGAADAGQP